MGQELIKLRSTVLAQFALAFVFWITLESNIIDERCALVTKLHAFGT